MTIYLDVAKEFYKRPAARYKVDGKYSGEEFREDILTKKIQEAINNNQQLEIDFSGVTMAGSSFLDEAFGGIVRSKKISSKSLLRMLIIKTKKESWKFEIIKYIEDAGKSKDEQKRND